MNPGGLRLSALDRPGVPPLVTVLTPVDNHGAVLRECIESVRAQTYPHWEYVLTDNRSTDDSLAIAREYASLDPRITVRVNDTRLDALEHHNLALGWLSPASAYCKVVEASDWLFPECLGAMVRVAETHPSVGLVSAYRLRGSWVDLDGLADIEALHGPSRDVDGLPGLTSVIPGREICRLSLLGAADVLGSPTSVLIRSDRVRARRPFLDPSSPRADGAAWFEVLCSSDLGFVHQVLTFARTHHLDGRPVRPLQEFATSPAGPLWTLSTYGPGCLEAREYERCLAEHLDQYYAFLARSVVSVRSRQFWAYHRAILRTIGHPLRRLRLLRALMAELVGFPLHVERAWRALAEIRRARALAHISPPREISPH